MMRKCKWLKYRTRNFQVAGSNPTAGHLQATLNKLLTYGVLRSTQPPTLCGTRNELQVSSYGVKA